MKKISFALIALVVLCSFCFGALADTTSVEIDYEGEYVTFDDMFNLYIPNSFTDCEVTDEMADSGIFALYQDETAGIAMSVQWILPDQETTLEAVANEFAASADYENVTMMSFNSIPFVVYDKADKSAFGCMCSDGTEDGGLYAFSFAPDNEESSTLALKIMASIS